MANIQHLEWLSEGPKSWNSRRAQQNFEPDLEDADLRDADLRDADLRRANLRRANLQRANLQRADLRVADLREADLREADLRGAILTRANLEMAKLTRANLLGAALRGVDLHRVELRGTSLRRVDLQKAGLRGANLQGEDLQGAKLQGADLRGADLKRADLREADLRGAKLREVDMRWANLEMADLRGAVLQGTHLQGAELWRAKVGSVFSSMGTNDLGEPKYTDLTLIRGLQQTQLNDMNGDMGTILPADLTRPHDWPALPTQTRQDTQPERLAAFGEDTLWGGASVPRSAIKSNIRQNGAAIKLTGESVLEQIKAYRDRIDKNNYLEIHNPEFKKDLLGFFENLNVNVSALQTSVPDQDADISDEDAENAAGYLKRFLVQLKENFAEHAGPENLADITATTIIIGACATLGTLFLGGKGAVLGGLIGGIVTNKSRTAKDIRKATETEQSVKPDPD